MGGVYQGLAGGVREGETGSQKGRHPRRGIVGMVKYRPLEMHWGLVQWQDY